MGLLPLSDGDRREMLAALGLSSTDQLFRSVPETIRGHRFELPPPLGEPELVAEISRLAARNRPLSGRDSFLGAGVYHRHVPALVRATLARPEFYTAYTPYQAEASQGTLQSIFEFQSMICALTALDVANASLYDGSTALAEAALLAAAHTGRQRIAVSDAIQPQAEAVLHTYCRGRGLGIDRLPSSGGQLSGDTVVACLDERHAALVVAQPSHLGTVQTLPPLAEAAHAAGALAICSVDPHAAAVLLPPGEAGFDVAVGDVQPLGIPASFGGPHAGFMAVSEPLLRRLPGRLVGLTRDARGGRAFTLTLQTREQHIRRERATSNICTNHALMALAATVYLALMGAGGLRAVATLSCQRAHALAEALASIAGFELAFPEGNFLWEFVLRCPGEAAEVADRLRERGIVAGLPLQPPLSDCLLVCCTELTQPAAIGRFAAAAAELVGSRSPGGLAPVAAR